ISCAVLQFVAQKRLTNRPSVCVGEGAESGVQLLCVNVEFRRRRRAQKERERKPSGPPFDCRWIGKYTLRPMCNVHLSFAKTSNRLISFTFVAERDILSLWVR